MQKAITELGSKPLAVPNPKRVAAGRRNREKRKGLTPEGRERLRQAAYAHQPWRYSTGPRTDEGKAAAARNGKYRQQGHLSIRELKADLRAFRSLVNEMKETRTAACNNRG